MTFIFFFYPFCKFNLVKNEQHCQWKRRGKFDQSPNSRRLFVTDRETKTQFLVDTGADLCVFPRPFIRGQRSKSNYELYAANDTVIPTYEFETFIPDLGFRRDYAWRFVIAEVSKPILGADFLDHYALLVDIRNNRLVDSSTTLSAIGHVAECKENWLGIRAIQGKYSWFELLLKYPEITKPAETFTEPKHSTKHFIHITPGPPVSEKPRRLAPDRLKQAKQEFQQMAQMNLVRLSKSSWSSLLHMVPKKDNQWRRRGDYRRHNAKTIPDKYPVPHIQDIE